MMNLNSRIKALIVLLLLPLMFSACAMLSGRESAGEYVDDTTITSAVKAGILGDASLKVLEINVETMQGVVQLSGFVDLPQNESRAISIARHTDGVKDVKDNLIVR